MRARMALMIQGDELELREVVLRNKPPSMLALSPKGTVPVLCTQDGQIIDESLDIMCWALPSDSEWFVLADQAEQLRLAHSFDRNFKPHLDAYKYHRAESASSRTKYRDTAATTLDDFEASLQRNPFLLGPRPQFLDLAVMPFVRQFAAVDGQWFDAQHRQGIRRWLDTWLAHPLFVGVMGKFLQWQEGTPGEKWPASASLGTSYFD